MDQETFKKLINYYLSCMDAEEAAQLQLRKNHKNKSYIFSPGNEKEALFSKDLPRVDLTIIDENQRNFIENRSPDKSTLVSLFYGFPVFIDEKDMLSPLFFTEVEAEFLDENKLRIRPKIKSFSVNRKHFRNYSAEEVQEICQELEGEFGSFEARLKSAEQYIPSLKNKETDKWVTQPILFRSDLSGTRQGLRYDLLYFLKNEDALKQNTALNGFLDLKCASVSSKERLRARPLILEISALNIQQEEAVVKGLDKKLSVVTGPPGTGKTQVVTTILASAVANNETILFSSNNNMPVDGVYERLGMSTGKTGNWLMRLGKQSKRQECYEIISELLDSIETSGQSKPNVDQDKEALHELDDQINKARDSLEKAKGIQEEITKLHNKEKVIEQQLPNDWVEQFASADPVELDQGHLKRLKKHSSPGGWLWFRRKFFGLSRFKNRHNTILDMICSNNDLLSEYENYYLHEESWDDAIKKSQRIVFMLKLHDTWFHCIKMRRRYEKKILQCASNSDVFDLKNKKSIVSLSFFEKLWLYNIHGAVIDAKEAFKNYFKDIDDFSAGRHKRLDKSISALQRFFPIWITTNQSASAIMPPQAGLFDLLVIDEAGQCDIPSIIPLLYRTKRAVIIGDPEQFKHITPIKADIDYRIAQENELEEIIDEWSFKSRSAFDRSFASANSTSFLKQHYRCHPDIIEFSNQNFYNGQLVEQIPLSQFQNRLPINESGLIWHNTIGQSIKADRGSWNPEEIKKTVYLFDQWEQQGLFADHKISYGIITPFKKQATEMKKALSAFPWFAAVEGRFTIGTAHSFQGSECDVLIYSPVVADGMEQYLIDFAADQNDLINVTVTRAKNLLCVVGDLHACQAAPPSTPLHQLASYAERIRIQQKHPMNSVEKAMAMILEELKLSYVPQYKLGQYRLDFLVNSPAGERYDIEIDGDIHLTAESIKHDESRNAYVESKDIKVIRFAARDVINKAELIKNRLARI